MKRDTVGPGAAAVHLVCADLLLDGFKAFIAPEGFHYDVVLDLDGTLLRIQVKSTGSVRPRPSRPTSLPVYQFSTDRKHRPERVGQKAKLSAYTDAHIDLFACVALDIKAVAYFPVTGRFVSGLHLYPPGTENWIRNGVNQRRLITEFPIREALGLRRSHSGPTELHRVSWESVADTATTPETLRSSVFLGISVDNQRNTA